MSSNNLSPSPPASRQTLIRRVTFDLTGLPPTPAEIDAFVSDHKPAAYERLVGRLLASKQFGVRWAQHWLDVARFAESNGYEHDDDRTQAWRYRDWVVNALNADVPYDQFIREQVAGDLLFPRSMESRVATGFLRAGPFHITGGNLDLKEMRQEWLTEAVAGIGTGVLGLSVGCARCHDHKFDPISQEEYYRLQAFFISTGNEDKKFATDDELARFNAAAKSVSALKKPIETQIAAIESPYRSKLKADKKLQLPEDYRAALSVDAKDRTPAQRKSASAANTLLNISWDELVNALTPSDRELRSRLRQRQFALDRTLPSPIPEAQGVANVLSGETSMKLLVRGEVHSPAQEVDPGYPKCLDLASKGIKPSANNPATLRLQLSEWLTSPDNPLTSRVIVNRLWQHIFGTGLVATPNDFGKNGQIPSNPELLNWLASSFTAKRQPSEKWNCGWSIKSMLFLMVTSSAYRQSSEVNDKSSKIDPDNQYLWRMNRKRLDAEALRDSILSVNGELNPLMGGPSVRIPLEPEIYQTIFTEYEPDNLWPITQGERQHVRRSLYLFRKRNVRLPMLTVFDQPDMMSSCGARNQTVHALQALTLINSQFMRQQSFLLAARLFAETPNSDSDRMDNLFRLTFGRKANMLERKATLKFVRSQTQLIRTNRKALNINVAGTTPMGIDPSHFQAWSDLCLATLNSNDFIFIR